MTKIKAVLFDYGMVLSGTPDTEAWVRMQELLGAQPESFAAAYWRHRDAYDRGVLTAKAYWEAVAKDLGREANGQTVVALCEADLAHWTRPNEAMISWAAALQRAKIKTGILSNLGDAMEAGLHLRFAWLKGFDHTTFSHRLGIAKPDLAIYEHAAKGLGVQPEEVLFLDDREENIAGARAAGMAAIQYAQHGEFVEAMKRAGFVDLLSPEGYIVCEDVA